ncbi:MAG: CotH kinase family protein [Myxococcales bacterium]|nr:CotH kinase family protein [Myxococcales bacterium]
MGHAVTTTVSFASTDALCVQITMPPEDFDVLRKDNRFGVPPGELIDIVFSQLTDDCTSGFPEHYDWFESDIVIDGTPLKRVGIRKKGFLGSVTGQGMFKPSLKLKTDRVVGKQLFGDTERITLNNNNQDPTRMHTCLAYELFAAAGYPAPRCNLANVMVNGASLGAYTHVEAVKKRFLRWAFGSDSGSLYEGTIADFTPGFVAGFGTGHLGRWQAKTADTDLTGAPLLAVSAALKLPDAQLEAALSKVVNLDRFITYWAMEVLIGHTDGYSTMRNNFFVYFDPTDEDRATFIPWGVDNVLVGGSDDGDLQPFVHGELARRLSRLPKMRQRFDSELARLRHEVWRPKALHLAINRLTQQIVAAQDDDDFADEAKELRSWVDKRGAQLDAAIAKGLPAGPRVATACDQLPKGGLGDPQAALHLLSALVFGW